MKVKRAQVGDLVKFKHKPYNRPTEIIEGEVTRTFLTGYFFALPPGAERPIMEAPWCIIEIRRP